MQLFRSTAFVKKVSPSLCFVEHRCPCGILGSQSWCTPEQAFDELLLLKRGGEVIYGGPLGYQSSDMVRYFEAIPGVQPISPSANPATWMLEISTISAEQRLRADLADLYRKSHLAA